MTARIPLTEAAAYATGLAVLVGWSAWRAWQAPHWLPLGVLTLAVLALGSLPIWLWPAYPVCLLVLPIAISVTRLGVELLGVRFGHNYSTAVDTSFGLDFGLPNHPAIIPARAALDVGLLGYLLGLGLAAEREWQLVHTLGFGLGVGYGGLCWLTSGVFWTQQAYALAMWSIAYSGVLVTVCGAGKVALLTGSAWVTVVAAVAVAATARPAVDEWMLRRSLRRVSFGVLGFGAGVALVKLLVLRTPSGSDGLALIAAAVAGGLVVGQAFKLHG